MKGLGRKVKVKKLHTRISILKISKNLKAKISKVFRLLAIKSISYGKYLKLITRY